LKSRIRIRKYVELKSRTRIRKHINWKRRIRGSDPQKLAGPARLAVESLTLSNGKSVGKKTRNENLIPVRN
jgi:hypothetical protein